MSAAHIHHVSSRDQNCGRRSRLERGGGGWIAGQWIPSDVWVHIVNSVTSVADVQSCRLSCTTGFHAVNESQAKRISLLLEQSVPRKYTIPHHVFVNALVLHPVIPHGSGVVMILRNGSTVEGLELAWVENGMLLQTPLGIGGNANAYAKSVSHIRFAPDGNQLAMLVKLNNPFQAPAPEDPLQRFRGLPDWKSSSFKPSDDCTVQIVDVVRDHNSTPLSLSVYTYSHVFVPEYGFNLLWRPNRCNAVPELMFVAMLHSGNSTTTYLVRWKDFRKSSAAPYIFMACVDGASKIFVDDKKNAMKDFSNTQVTSRVELSEDGKSIFFDTISKVGVLQFDQIDDPSRAFVIRSDMNNDPDQPERRSDTHTLTAPIGRAAPSKQTSTLRQKMWGRTPRISQMSPDGSLVCSLLYVKQFPDSCSPCLSIEMLCNKSGNSMFLNYLQPLDCSNLSPSFSFDKAANTVRRVVGFSKNSSLVWVRNAVITPKRCQVSNGLPCFMDAKSGRIIQNFGVSRRRHRYKHIQIATDALTVYGSRIDRDCVVIDVIDVLSGNVLKSVNLAGPLRKHEPTSWCQFQSMDNDRTAITTLARGDMDMLWENSNGAVLGCEWEPM